VCSTFYFSFFVNFFLFFVLNLRSYIFFLSFPLFIVNQFSIFTLFRFCTKCAQWTIGTIFRFVYFKRSFKPIFIFSIRLIRKIQSSIVRTNKRIRFGIILPVCCFKRVILKLLFLLFPILIICNNWNSFTLV